MKNLIAGFIYMEGHNHNHSSELRNLKKSRLGWAIIINLIFMICEVAGGIYSNSLALVSDAGHMLTHVFALSMSYFAISLTARPANNWKTFGYYRAEVLAAFVNGIFLLLVTVLIVYEAVILIMHPAAIKTMEMFIIAVIGLAANLCSVFLLSSSTKGDLNIKSAFVHVIGDAVSSIMVIAGAVIIYYTGNYIVDPILSIIISILILVWGGRLLRDSAYILLESTPKNIDLDVLQDILKKEIPEIIEVHDIHVWELTSSLYCATMHLVVENIRLDCAKDLLADVQTLLHDRFSIEHATIQFEITSDNCRHTEGVF